MITCRLEELATEVREFGARRWWSAGLAGELHSALRRIHDGIRHGRARRQPGTCSRPGLL